MIDLCWVCDRYLQSQHWEGWGKRIPVSLSQPGLKGGQIPGQSKLPNKTPFPIKHFNFL